MSYSVGWKVTLGYDFEKWYVCCPDPDPTSSTSEREREKEKDKHSKKKRSHCSQRKVSEEEDE